MTRMSHRLPRLQKEGLITLKELFIDGTKIEANANRYTFVWCGSINYHLAGLLDVIDSLYGKYNALLNEKGYSSKYELGNAQMFVIEGMDKVRDVIAKNRKRKLTKHKKLSNNTIIEIDNCSPLELLKENHVASYIKLQDHEKRKTRAYTKDIGKHSNMTIRIFEDERYYIYHDGRELSHVRTETKEQDGYTDCGGCEHKARCLYKYDAEKDAEKSKVMKVNERCEELKEESHANVQSERGIRNRQIRSIQTEGHICFLEKGLKIGISRQPPFYHGKVRPMIKKALRAGGILSCV